MNDSAKDEILIEMIQDLDNKIKFLNQQIDDGFCDLTHGGQRNMIMCEIRQYLECELSLVGYRTLTKYRVQKAENAKKPPITQLDFKKMFQ